MSKYDVILFDLDGTLVDSKMGITKSVQYSLNSFGIVEDCLDNLEKFIGPPLKDSFKEFYNFDDDKADKAVEKYRECYEEKGVFENDVYHLIPELLEKLNLKGKKLMVATSKPTVFAEKILKYFDMFKYFSKVVGSNLDGTRVKKSEIIAYALNNEIDLNKDKVVMIGDRKHDIIGANEMNVDCISVLYGYGSREEFEAHKPKYIVDSVESLEKILL